MDQKAKKAKKSVVQSVIRDIFEAPAEIGREAARQVGILPQKEDPERGKKEKEVLKKRADEERAVSLQRAKVIEGEIHKMVKQRQEARAARQVKIETPKSKEQPPLVEPRTKRRRNVFQGAALGIKAALRKSRAELAGGRVSG